MPRGREKDSLSGGSAEGRVREGRLVAGRERVGDVSMVITMCEGCCGGGESEGK